MNRPQPSDTRRWPSYRLSPFQESYPPCIECSGGGSRSGGPRDPRPYLRTPAIRQRGIALAQTFLGIIISYRPFRVPVARRHPRGNGAGGRQITGMLRSPRRDARLQPRGQSVLDP